MTAIGLIISFLGIPIAIFFGIACNVKNRPLPIYCLAIGPLLAWVGFAIVVVNSSLLR